jgi:hypothetical protein
MYGVLADRESRYSTLTEISHTLHEVPSIDRICATEKTDGTSGGVIVRTHTKILIIAMDHVNPSES